MKPVCFYTTTKQVMYIQKEKTL